MIICGIDWSLSCPAITVFNGESFSVDACKFYFYNDKKKFMGHPRFIGTQYDEWEKLHEPAALCCWTSYLVVQV